jgi:hypothetical protein
MWGPQVISWLIHPIKTYHKPEMFEFFAPTFGGPHFVGYDGSMFFFGDTCPSKLTKLHLGRRSCKSAAAPPVSSDTSLQHSKPRKCMDHSNTTITKTGQLSPTGTHQAHHSLLGLCRSPVCSFVISSFSVWYSNKRFRNMYFNHFQSAFSYFPKCCLISPLWPISLG